jgi:hypothetical protein
MEQQIQEKPAKVNTDPEGVETEAGVILDLSKICVQPLFC